MRKEITNEKVEIFDRKDSIGASFFFCTMSVFMFCVYSYNETTRYIDLPHIELNTLPLYIVVVISIAYTMVGLLYRINIDMITILLLFRLALPILPAVYTQISDHFMVNYVTSALCVIAYIMGMNYTANQEKTVNVIKFIFYTVCVQSIVESFIGNTTFFDSVYAYKRDLTIPIGASNAIASRIIPCFAFLYTQENNKKKKLLYAILVFFVVALTKSRGGIMTVIMATGLMIVWKGKFSVNSIIKFIFVIAVLFIVSYLFFTNNSVGQATFSTSDGSVVGRYERWEKGLELFEEHPIFGNGFSVQSLQSDYHNFFIQILVRSGLIGLTFFFYFIYNFVKMVSVYWYSKYVRACILFALCLLMQGLVEVVLFNYISDIMLWFVLGSMTCACNILKQGGKKSDGCSYS